jgi:hypothetical protein
MFQRRLREVSEGWLRSDSLILIGENMKDLKHKLKRKSKEWLINQLVELSIADDGNADRIMLNLVAEDGGDHARVAKFRHQLDKAAGEIVEHGPGSWNSQLPTTGFDTVAGALAVLLPQNLEAVIAISEYALIKLDNVFELQDECELEYLVDAFRHLHLEACRKLKPDRCSLGKRLAELVQQTEWGFFDGPPDGYGEVLGQEGLSAFLSTAAAK